MTDSVETIRCTNCKRDVSSRNFMIHDIHCKKNIYLCPKCNEPVSHAGKEEHDSNNHVLVYCTDCHTQLEKYRLDDHKTNICSHRKVKCSICEIEVGANELTDHEYYCGARTQKCAECGEYVMLKYTKLHIDSNHAFLKISDEPGPSPSWQNGRRTLGNFFPDLSLIDSPSQPQSRKKFGRNESSRPQGRGSPHQSKNSPSLNKAETTHNVHRDDEEIAASPPRKVIGSINGGTVDRETRKTGNCKDARNAGNFHDFREESNRVVKMMSNSLESPPAKGKETGASTSPISNDRGVALKETVKVVKDTSGDGEPEIAPESLAADYDPFSWGESRLPCAFCDSLFAADALMSHERKCMRSKERKPGNDEEATAGGKSSDPPAAPPRKENKEEVVEDCRLPCEFCDSLFPAGDLPDHQEDCVRRKRTAPRRESAAAPSPRKSRATNSESPPPATGRDPSGDAVPRSEKRDVVDDCRLPCEFCGSLFAAIDLPHHQEECLRGRAKFAAAKRESLANGGTKDQTPSKSQSKCPSATRDSPGRVRNGDETEVDRLPCEFCGSLFATSDLPDHQDECLTKEFRGRAKRESLPNGKIEEEGTSPTTPGDAEAPRVGNEMEKDVDRLPCEFCGSLCAAADLPDHQEECMRSKWRAAKRETVAPAPPTRENGDEAEVDRLPCEFCDSLFAASDLPEHQEDCMRAKWRAPKRESANEGKSEATTASPPPPPSPRRDLRPAERQNNDETEADRLPCEFCDSLFPGGDLPQHQEDCLRRKRAASRRESAAATPTARKSNAAVSESPPSSPKGKDSRDADAAAREEKNEDFRLPCEFCGAPFPATRLPAHQEECLRGKWKARKAASPSGSKEAAAAAPSSAGESPGGDVAARIDDAATATERLPCEFCGSLFDVSALLKHQRNCMLLH